MATRQDLWISSEILRHVNILHDCLDACRYLLKGLEPDTGIVLVMTPAEANDRIRSHSNAAKINKVALSEFIDKVGTTEAQAALNSVGVDVQALKADVADMGSYADYIYNNVLTEDHAVMAAFLDTNLPKFISVRRRWAL